MADKAVAGINTQILLDKIKTSMNGNYSLTPAALGSSSGDGWIYAEKDVTTSSADLLGTTEDFLGSVTGAGNIVAGDKIPWIAIKHTGTTDGSTATSEGIMLSLVVGGTAAYNLADGIFLGKNELIVLKIPNVTVADLHAITVTSSGGKPTSAGSGSVRVRVAAVITNVS
jgi:hypothetical protein